MKLLLVQLSLLVCVCVISSANAMRKREVHRIILREEVKKPKRSIKHHHRRPKPTYSTIGDFDYSSENYNFGNRDNSYEDTRFQHFPPHHYVDNYAPHFVNDEKFRKKRQKHQKPFDWNNFKRPHQEFVEDSRPELSDESYYPSYDNFPDYSFKQNVVDFKYSTIPYSGYDAQFPLQQNQVFNDTHTIYDTWKNVDFRNNENVPFVPSTFIDTNKDVFDYKPKYHRNETTKKPKRNVTTRQRRKKIKNNFRH